MITELTTSGLTRHYGDIHAVESVDLAVTRGSRHALIGPNGAGKSTLLGLLSGSVRATAGSIRLAEHDVTRWSEPTRARNGMVRTFQHPSVFDTLTAAQNVALAIPRSDRITVRNRVKQALTQVALLDLAGRRAESLAHGQRRRLELAMVLASRPRVLMLDEPAAGMTEAERFTFADVLRTLSSDVTVILVEHDLDLVFSLATRLTVLHLGRVLAEGDARSVRSSRAVQDAYLGQRSGGRP